MALEYRRNGILISTDPTLLDMDCVHGYLRRSYWSPDIRRDIVERAAQGSLCYGIYDPASARPDGRPLQVGYGRVVTDMGVIAYICDVFVLESHRGRGLSKFLVESMLAHPELTCVRRWLLATADAHGLYTRYGFAPVPAGRWLERIDLTSWKERPSV